MAKLAFDIAGAVVVAAMGGLAGWSAAIRRQRAAVASAAPTAVTRLDAHLASSASSAKSLPPETASLRRDVQEVFDAKEASQDLEVLDRLLRDIRDLSSAGEAVFWRWVEARQTLVPSAWSTEGAARPAFFNVKAWGQLVRWSAEENVLQLEGDVDGAPLFAAAPVASGANICGVLTLTAATGLRLDQDAARAWMPRFATQVGSLIQLFDVRRDYGIRMRQSGAILDAVKRLQGHTSVSKLADALCETAREVTSAPVAGLVRWNAVEQHGVVESISAGTEIESGFHITADSLVGRACAQRLPLTLDDAQSETREQCPFGGLPRVVGSVAVVPVMSGEEVIGAIVVEGSQPGDVSRHEARNVGLLAAVARGPLEVGWEIEEVSRRARTDPLTGLSNRRHFDEQLRRVVLETDRFGGACSLILIDLDHFKNVNDEHGHDCGDAVLKHVSKLFADAVRTVDTCARHGGEELSILLPQTPETGATELAERLRAMLESRAVGFGGESIKVTASFGVATYPVPVPYGDWLVSAADKALYEAKAAGRNCVKVIRANHVTSALYKSR